MPYNRVPENQIIYYLLRQRISAYFTSALIIKNFGLAEEKLYCIEEINVTASGKTLTSVGVALPKLGDYESFIWHIEEVKI